jgi:hypothetical protein
MGGGARGSFAKAFLSFEEPAMSEAANAPRFSRFTKHIILGSVFAGVLCSIPVLGLLNCLFCLLNISGIFLALWMYLRANPEDSVSGSEAAGFGAIAGAGAGLICGAAQLLFSGAMLASLMDEIPNAKEAQAALAVIGVMLIPLLMMLFAGFGALGVMLGMRMFFNRRVHRH